MICVIYTHPDLLWELTALHRPLTGLRGQGEREERKWKGREGKGWEREKRGRCEG